MPASLSRGLFLLSATTCFALSACGVGNTGTAQPSSSGPTIAPTVRPTVGIPGTGPGNVGATPQPVITDYGPAVTAAFDALPLGKLAFNPPSQMQAGVLDQIGVRVSLAPDSTFTGGMPGTGTAQTSDAKVAPFMSARLTGEAQAFDIQALSEEVQFVPDVGYTEWDWNVTPTASGSHYLDLSVSALVVIPGAGEKKHSVPAKHRHVIVHVNLGYTLNKFVVSYWQWLFATTLPVAGGILAFIRWYLKRRQRQRRASKPRGGTRAPVPREPAHAPHPPAGRGNDRR